MSVELVQRGSMRAAYAFQVVNIFVSILAVPLLLRYLSVSEYVLWSLFTTLGSVTLQLQNGIQPVAVRGLARHFHEENGRALLDTLAVAHNNYLKLVGLVCGPLLILGYFYLNHLALGRSSSQINIAWTLFVAAYGVNYFFASNSAILLGMASIVEYNAINTFTRLLYIVSMFTFLALNFGLLGICAAFATSVVAGVALTVVFAHRRLDQFLISTSARAQGDLSAKPPEGKTWTYVGYSILSYLLYNGMLLIAALLFPSRLVASYGLSLQTVSLISAFAQVPLQVWLNSVVRAISNGDGFEIRRQLLRSLVLGNSIMLAGVVLLLCFGNLLVALLASKLHFVSWLELSALFFAFLIEFNILVLASFLVCYHNFKFVRYYLRSAVPSMLAAGISAWLTHELLLSLVLVPMTIQAIFCLPVLARMLVLQMPPALTA